MYIKIIISRFSV